MVKKVKDNLIVGLLRLVEDGKIKISEIRDDDYRKEVEERVIRNENVED